MAFCVVALCLILAANTLSAFSKLDYKEEEQDIYTCDIEGMVEQSDHRLHGYLTNCKTPEMECTVEGNYLMKSVTTVDCRLPSNDTYLIPKKTCSFQFYYRRSFCFNNSRCYSITMACDENHYRPTTLLTIYILIALIIALIVLGCIGYWVYDCCYKTNAINIPEQDRRLEKVRRQSLKQSKREQPSGEEHSGLTMETAI